MFPGAYKLKEGSQSAHYPSVGQSDATVTMAAPSASAYRSGHSAYAGMNLAKIDIHSYY